MTKPIINCFLFFTICLISFIANSETKEKQKNIEIAFVLDIEKTENESFEKIKKNIWSIANSIISSNENSNIKMAIVTYAQWTDKYSVSGLPLTDDIQEIHNKIISIEELSEPNSFNESLDKITNGLGWSGENETKRIIFHISKNKLIENDEYPAYKNIISRTANEKITINTIQIGGNLGTTNYLERLSQLGQGSFISDSKENHIINTPFDNDIVKLQLLIDKTIIPYGPNINKINLTEKIEKKRKSSNGVVIENAKFYSKKNKGGKVITGDGDLISDVVDKKINLAEIPENLLPEILKGENINKKQEFIENQLNKRKKLEEAMSILISERDDYLIEQNKNSRKKSSFDLFLEKDFLQQVK